MSKELFQVEMGSLYPALCRIEARGWIKAVWGISDNNRKARYYSLTHSGRKQLGEETNRWETLSTTINSMLRAT
jgi:DNA-binding PadR family transcriptional regulator